MYHVHLCFSCLFTYNLYFLLSPHCLSFNKQPRRIVNNVLNLPPGGRPTSCNTVFTTDILWTVDVRPTILANLSHWVYTVQHDARINVVDVAGSICDSLLANPTKTNSENPTKTNVHNYSFLSYNTSRWYRYWFISEYDEHSSENVGLDSNGSL